MNFNKLKIPDLIVFEPNLYLDYRGYFTETYNKKIIESIIGYSLNFCQDNETKSSYGVLGGLHYQSKPHSQTKLIRVVKGKILDVVVDLRKDSKTFGVHNSIILSEKNKKQLLVPRGFAHGFISLAEESIVLYKVDKYYNPESERGIIFNDKDLGIDWKLSPSKFIISEKDKLLPPFRDIKI